MIYDKLENLPKYLGLDKNLDVAIKWLKTAELNDLPLGKTPIMGDDVFAVHVETESYDHANALFETHHTYGDVQIAVDEREVFYMDMPERMVNLHTAWSDKDDVILHKFDSNRNRFRPKKGEFLIFFPKETHLPKYMGFKTKFRKIIVKFKYSGK